MFQKAVKSKSKLRAAIFGASGSGKTFSALRVATGLGEKIAVIDSERGSSSKYADRFNFDVCDLEKRTIESYCDAIKSASGYDVLIIDSISHAWQELLEEVDKIAETKYKGNSWSAWSKATPIQRKFIECILNFSGHVIVTMRSKTEWTIERNDNGKSTPRRVGLAPEQGKGIEYEFDMLLELSNDHSCHVIKDRTGMYQDAVIDKLSEDFGKELKNWLNDGVLIVSAIELINTLFKTSSNLEDVNKLQEELTKRKWKSDLERKEASILFKQKKEELEKVLAEQDLEFNNIKQEEE
jgi:hypothetical protein